MHATRICRSSVQVPAASAFSLGSFPRPRDRVTPPLPRKGEGVGGRGTPGEQGGAPRANREGHPGRTKRKARPSGRAPLFATEVATLDQPGPLPWSVETPQENLPR